MNNKEEILNYILSLKDVQRKEISVGEDIFYINQEPFVIFNIKKDPIKISIRCDKQLVKLLTQKYDEVMPGTGLNPTQWITVIRTGQLTDQEIIDLISGGYQEAIKISEN